MSIYAHLDALTEKHQIISQQIKEAYRAHEPDHSVRGLKKKRLRVEEEMERVYGMALAESPRTGTH